MRIRRTSVSFPASFSTSTRGHVAPIFSEQPMYTNGSGTMWSAPMYESAPIRAPASIQYTNVTKRARLPDPVFDPLPDVVEPPPKTEPEPEPEPEPDPELKPTLKAFIDLSSKTKTQHLADLYTSMVSHEPEIYAAMDKGTKEELMQEYVSLALKAYTKILLEPDTNTGVQTINLYRETLKRLEEDPKTWFIAYETIKNSLKTTLQREPKDTIDINYFLPDEIHDFSDLRTNNEKGVFMDEKKRHDKTASDMYLKRIYAIQFIRHVVKQLTGANPDTIELKVVLNRYIQDIYHALTVVEINELLLEAEGHIFEYIYDGNSDVPELQLEYSQENRDSLYDISSTYYLNALIKEQITIMYDENTSLEEKANAYVEAYELINSITSGTYDGKKLAIYKNKRVPIIQPVNKKIIDASCVKEIRGQPGNGDCLFYSIADDLLDKNRLELNTLKPAADNLRVLVSAFLLVEFVHNPIYQQLIQAEVGMSYKKYLDSIRKPGGQWGGELEIAMFAKYMRINIVVLQKYSEGYLIVGSYNDQATRRIAILYNGRDHYESLRLTDRGWQEILKMRNV